MFGIKDSQSSDFSSETFKNDMEQIKNNLKDEKVNIVYEFDFMIF